jgi:DNA topoisomerase-1
MSSKYDKYAFEKRLVIVESPAKCATIEKYLGDSYKCIATYGHFREISSLKDITMTDTTINIKYTMIEDSYKTSQIKRIKEEIGGADEILLATDDDREGEAIAWHVCDAFNLPITTTKRIIFHEITETAIVNATMNPTIVNMCIVRAQQARQVLDLIVGFNVSPILWKCVQSNKSNSLSAGRCQTPALQIVYDNFNEINSNKGRKVYNTTGTFTNLNISFALNKEFDSELDAEYFLENDASHEHIFEKSGLKTIVKSPPLPFTTSRLQQVASNEMHYSPKETMKLCQTLYEQGFITYMRTDNTKYSAEFVSSCTQFIMTTFSSKDYVSPKINELVIGNNANKVGAQEAHEAVRCTNIYMTPSTVTTLDAKEHKMYVLIWKNSLESLMSDASFSSFISSLSAFDSFFYKHTCEQIVFPGFMIVANKYEKDSTTSAYAYLSAIKSGTIIEYKKIESKQTILGLKQRYTEARLVSLLEENGIGRPSTYASLVDKIQQRNYVKKQDVDGTMTSFTDFELDGDNLSEIKRERLVGAEKNKLVIQPLGIIVIELLLKNFHSLFNYDYTKEMEMDLDLIANARDYDNNPSKWVTLCLKCEKVVTDLIRSITNTQKMVLNIDDEHTYIIGKHGPVVKKVENGVTSFLPVNKNLDIHKLEKGEYVLDDVVEKPEATSVCLGNYKGDELIVKKGKYGLYATYGSNKLSLKMFGNRPIENIKFTDVFAILEDEGVLKPSYNKDQKAKKIVRELSASITIRKGKWGHYIYHQTTQMQKPSFFDMKTFEKDTKQKCDKCELHVLKEWVKTKYNIS